MRLAGRRGTRLALATAATIVVAAAAILGADRIGRSPAGPGASTVPAGPVVATTRDGPFEVTIRASKGAYAEDEAIVITGSLTYLGPDAAVRIGHAQGVARQPIAFAIVEPVIGDLEVGTMWLTSCEHSTLQRDRAVEVAFAKSGGWSGDDPQASAYLAYVRDPVFRLPAGVWHVRVTAWFSVGDCSATGHEIVAELTLVVHAPDGSVPTAFPTAIAIAP